MAVQLTSLAEIKDIISESKKKLDAEGGFKNVIMCACGGSHACFWPAEYFIRSESKDMVVYNITANEFNYARPACLGKNSLVITLSLSGSTPETVAAAKNAKEAGAVVISIVAMEHTKLAENADYVVYYGTEDKVPCYGHNQYLILALAVEIVNQTEGYKDYDKMMAGFDRITDIVIKAVAQVHDRAMKWGEENKDERIIYTIGSGSSFYVAYMQTICMYMEMEWVDSNAIHAGEFFHGPFEVTEYDKRFMIFMNEGKTRALDERALKFLKNYADKITVVDSKELGLLAIDPEVVDYFNPLLLWPVAMEYAEGLARAKKHPLFMRRYMGKVQY